LSQIETINNYPYSKFIKTMLRKLFFTIFPAVFTMFSVNAQQALGGGEDIKSPEIHGDNSVTFRLQAPNASEVKISGDWMPSEGWVPGSEKMEKNEKGIWAYTTKPLESELYSYAFIIDGFKQLIPITLSSTGM
jgi:1,4-alpha-glucan branching enzyme